MHKIAICHLEESTMESKGLNVAVVGSCIYEVTCNVPRFPKPGESMIIPEIRQSLGGKGFNQAIALSRLGAQVLFIGAVGEDWMGNAFSVFADKEGVEFYAERQATSTGICVPIVTPDGVSSIIVDVGASFKLAPNHVDTVLRGHIWDAILCHNEVPQSALDVVVEQSKARQIPLFFNPAPWLPGRLNYLRAADVVILNEIEAQELVTESNLTGTSIAMNPEELLRKCGAACSAKVVILTLGVNGSIALIDGNVIKVPITPVNAIDSTGAGDAYVAAITFGLSKSWPFSHALALASAAGAWACTQFGGAASMPVLSQIEALAHSSVLWG
jgi:ribokinase